MRQIELEQVCVEDRQATIYERQQTLVVVDFLLEGEADVPCKTFEMP